MVRRQRGNWVPRGLALVGSIGAFLGFWQLAASNPHPASAAANVAATPTASYTLPSGSSANNPIPLPGAPHGATGLS